MSEGAELRRQVAGGSRRDLFLASLQEGGRGLSPRSSSLSVAVSAPATPAFQRDPAAPAPQNRAVGDLFQEASCAALAGPETEGDDRRPKLPIWNYNRPFLTGMHMLEGAAAKDGKDLQNFSPQVQEIRGEFRQCPVLVQAFRGGIKDGMLRGGCKGEGQKLKDGNLGEGGRMCRRAVSGRHVLQEVNGRGRGVCRRAKLRSGADERAEACQ